MADAKAPGAPPTDGSDGRPASTAIGRPKKKAAWRPRLRAIHRDVGYVAVGLTFVYALSGIAVNHITDWTDGDPSFKTYSRTVDVGRLEGDDEAIVLALRKRFGITETPREVYRASPEQLEILFDKRSLHLDTAQGTVVDEGQEPRFILRVANWLHLNRGRRRGPTSPTRMRRGSCCSRRAVSS